MNWNQLEQQWKQMGGAVKARWDRLTDEDLRVVAGKKDPLIGKLQERYGTAKAETEHEVSQWLTAYVPERDHWDMRLEEPRASKLTPRQ